MGEIRRHSRVHRHSARQGRGVGRRGRSQTTEESDGPCLRPQRIESVDATFSLGRQQGAYTWRSPASSVASFNSALPNLNLLTSFRTQLVDKWKDIAASEASGGPPTIDMWTWMGKATLDS